MDRKQENEEKLQKVEQRINYMQQVSESSEKKYSPGMKESAKKALIGLMKEREDLLKLLGR